MAALVQRRFHELHDTNSRAYFLFVSSARWLGFRLDAICSVLLIAGTFAAVAAKHAAGGVLGGGDNPGLIGQFVDVEILEALPHSLRGQLAG